MSPHGVTNRAVRLLKRIDTAAGGLAADLSLYTLSAAFALLTAATSTLLPHRAWGAIATWAYAIAAGAVLAQLVLHRPRPAARAAITWLTWTTAALLPLIVQAVQRAGGRTDRAQEEVLVVERMGERLLHDGTPYLSRDAIAALPADERLLGYSPYQPGMAVFGLPRAAFGDAFWTDARVWFAVVTAAALVTAIVVLHAATTPRMVRATQAATVLPICALTLATGGDDLPVLALCLLALALTATHHFGWAGLAVGAAAATKLFALPVLAVLAFLAIATHRKNAHRSPRTPTHHQNADRSPTTGAHHQDTDRSPATAATRERGGRSPLALLPGALGLPVLALIPPLLVAPDAATENVIRFPLGHGLVTSPAQSPFPGYLIAQTLPAGRLVALGLLVTVAALIAVRLFRRPPTTATSAALICGWGLLAAILLMPTTRFGYLLYPFAFLLWAAALAASSPPQSDVWSPSFTQQGHSRTPPAR
jgi:hypothetical protein